MKFAVKGRMMIEFEDIIEIPDAETMDGDTRYTEIENKFWHDVDHCIIPDNDVRMGNMTTVEFSYSKEK